MKYIFIVNPESGKKKGLQAGKAIEEYCKNLNIDYKIIYTYRPGDAEYIAGNYSTLDECIIYSVGGDGTLNEVVNGLAFSSAKLGVIPVGSGNDFYKTIMESSNQTIDLGRVNGRFFINIASLGIDAEIAKSANEQKEKNIPSNLIYVSSIAKNLFKFKGIKLQIDSSKKDLTILTICNGRYYGGGFKIAPNAELSDGLLDIYEVERLGKVKTLKLLTKLLQGTHELDNSVTMYRTNKISVDSNYRLICNVDGEILEGTNFNFVIEKDAIHLHTEDELGINKLLRLKKIIK